MFNNEEYQSIDLDIALQNAGDDRSQIRKEIMAFIDAAVSLERRMEKVSQLEPWMELLEKAQKIGADEAIDWLKSFLSNLEGCYRADCQIIGEFKKQFKQIITEVSNSLSSLEEFRFFTTKAINKDGSFLKNAKILLVEDMKHNRVLLKKILTKRECQIVEAENGMDALDKWENQGPFDLIVMDMNMPVMVLSSAIRSMMVSTGLFDSFFAIS